MNESGTEKKLKKNLRYYSLDFWRGVACLSVIVFHSTFYITESPGRIRGDIISTTIFKFLSYGWAGVPFFFVISGYCIAAACESVGLNKTSTGKYFFRRFKRIFPPYWFALLFVLAVHFASQLILRYDFLCDNTVPMVSPASLSPWHWFGTLSLTEIWRSHIIGPPDRPLLGPAWSLCYEEQFYAVCGILIFLGRKKFYRALAVLTLVVAGILIFDHTIYMLPVAGFFFDGRWLMFAAGVLVFYVIKIAGPTAPKKAMMLLGAAFVVVAIWAAWRRFKLNAATELAFAFAFAFALIPLFRHDVKMAGSKLLRPVTFCGTMCYSVYLIHLPVVKGVTQFFYRMGVTREWPTLAITIPVTIIVTVGIAWIFHLLVERRFMNTPSPLAPPAKRPQALSPTPITVAEPVAESEA